MEISKIIDHSRLRKESEESNVPIVELLLKKIKKISHATKINYTLFAVCPNSENVLKAAIRSAKRANSPIMFAATLNQVDIDGGYTGWTQDDLVRIIKEEVYRIDFRGPVVIGIDHGGPWAKDIQTIEKWDLNRSMDWIKKSFKAAILAGYDLIHIDPTIDIFKKQIEIETVVERTLELIIDSEQFRKLRQIKPISYEVGTEEVHGGFSDIKIFKKFLYLLKDGLAKKGFGYLWPIFVVAKVGTDLHTAIFDPEAAKSVVKIAGEYGSYIKGHYTDFVSNLEDYPKIAIGAANVGPEFTLSEYEAFEKLCKIEEDLYKKNRLGVKSNYIKILEKAVLDSLRWKKWLKDGEKDFNSLSKERREWIIRTSARYVWAYPEVKCSQNLLYKNLQQNGIDVENFILINIEKSMDKYYRAFNLIDLNLKI